MKKKIIIAGLLMTGVLSLNSCVKDNESDAVQNQRNAQTEKTKAEAARELAEAEYKKAQAEHELITAAKEKALGEVEVKAATISVTLAELDLKVKQGANEFEIEAAKLNAQAGVRSATAAFVAERKKEELASSAYEASIEVFKEAAIKKAMVDAQASLTTTYNERLDNLVKDLDAKTTSYTTALKDLSDAEETVSHKSLLVASYEAGFTTYESLLKKLVADKKYDISKMEAQIGALEKVSQDKGAATSDLAAKQVEEGTLQIEAYSLAKELEKTYFDSEEEVKQFAKGAPDSKFFDALAVLELENGAIKYVLEDHIEGAGTSAKTEDIEASVKGSKKNGTTDVFSTTEKYVAYTEIEAMTADQLMDYFVNGKELSRLIQIESLGLADKKKTKADLEKQIKDHIDNVYNDAQKDYRDAKETDSDYLTKANKAKQAQEDLDKLNRKLEEADKKLKEARKFSELRTELEEGAKELETEIAEFLKKQKEVLDAYDKLDEKNEEILKVNAQIEAYRNILDKNSTLPLTEQDIKEGISTLRENIAKAQAEIINFTTDSTKNPEQALTVVKKDLETAKQELEEARRVVEARKAAYEAAIKALEDYNKNKA